MSLLEAESPNRDQVQALHTSKGGTHPRDAVYISEKKKRMDENRPQEGKPELCLTFLYLLYRQFHIIVILDYYKEGGILIISVKAL